MNLRTVKAYLLTEQFEHFWTYKSPAWAKKFFKAWTRQDMYSRIDPVKDVAKMLRRHEKLIINWFRARKKINNGIAEGFNLNINSGSQTAKIIWQSEDAEANLPQIHPQIWVRRPI